MPWRLIAQRRFEKSGTKKEAFRRGREGFFVFRGLSWSQAQNGKGFYCSASNGPALCHAAGARAYFFLPFVVLFLLDFELDDFLAELFFVAMALGPPFYVAQSKER